MRTIIVEDSRLARLELKTLLEDLPQVELLGEAANADEARELIEDVDPELVFLDIQMPGETGFELLESLEVVPLIIFTTAYDEYAIKSFEYNTLDYILKPINPERLEKALSKITEERIPFEEQQTFSKDGQRLDSNKQVFVKDGDKCWLVRLKDIELFEVCGNYSRVFFDNHKPLILRSLNQLEERLNPEHFFRANRQQIINIGAIKSIETWFNGRLKVTTHNDREIEVSRRQAVKFKELLSL